MSSPHNIACLYMLNITEKDHNAEFNSTGFIKKKPSIFPVTILV